MSITHITSLAHLRQVLPSNGLSVIDFHATWCGPCHAIAPTFESLSRKYKTVKFLKCDVDAASDVAQEYSVRAMPTFVFLKGTTRVDQVQGANPSGLEAALRKLTADTTSSQSFQGKGQTLGGPSSSTPATTLPVAGANGVLDINPQLKIFIALIAAYLVLWYLSA